MTSRASQKFLLLRPLTMLELGPLAEAKGFDVALSKKLIA